MNPTDYNNFTASPANPIIEGGDAKPIDMTELVPVIQEWRRIYEELEELKQQTGERKKRVKLLDNIIMEKMKMGNIGALNLKNGQILYKKKETKEGLTPKTVQKLLTEHFQDEKAAAEAMKYMLENRESRIKEKIQYEK